ncbi:transporter [Marinomonas sp. THO17]|uniref:SphA family protein n=1 Tax=Marinomonas sp. THO17 TaxID=3149048 RepID=UPI00336BD36F
MKPLNKIISCALATAITAGFSLSANASENGITITPMGTYDFGSGFLPPESDIGLFGLRYAYYTTDTQKDGNGDKFSGRDFSLDVQAISILYMKMTDTELFGGKYGFSVIMPMLNLDGDITIFNGNTPVFQNEGEVFRQGDMFITPLILGWTPSPNLAMNAQFSIQAPTGDYDQNKFVNSGVNHWTIAPSFGFTYINQTGLEVSSFIELNVNTKNEDTDYKSGSSLRYDFGIGQHVGAWTLGVGGYYFNQFTDDKTYSGYTGNAITDGNKGEVAAVGPAASFMKPGLPTVSFHAYKEFNAKNRAEGYNLAVRLGAVF